MSRSRRSVEGVWELLEGVWGFLGVWESLGVCAAVTSVVCWQTFSSETPPPAQTANKRRPLRHTL